MPTPDRSHALDHVVLVLFENRSLDNMLGHLYGPEDGKNFDGVIGKNLSNPIPEWAEHSAERKTVPCSSTQRRPGLTDAAPGIAATGRRLAALSHARVGYARVGAGSP